MPYIMDLSTMVVFFKPLQENKRWLIYDFDIVSRDVKKFKSKDLKDYKKIPKK